MAVSNLLHENKRFSQTVFDLVQNNLQKNWFRIFLFTCISFHAISLFNGIMEVDAMLYATIAKHIILSNDWINLVGNSQDWLDKPHLPFWIIALSFKIFGINDFAYKFPAFLSLLVGLGYCYELAKEMYDVKMAKVAVIIYITSLHLFLAVFDVRAEAYLTTFIIAATYHLYRSLPHKFSWHIIAAAFFCGAACITKGIFVLITVAGGFIIYWIFNRQWKELLQPKWWVLILLTFVFILPELYCLYLQFDLHPEKVVFGKINVSGIRFFFWDSQFGRFFNNGPIKGDGDVFFFLHTFLWAFLPWSFIGYAALVASFKKMDKKKSRLLILSGSAIITFLLFSFSRFQLPHYIVIIFPHFAVISAVYLTRIKNEMVLKKWNYLLVFIFFVSIAAIVLLSFITRFNYLPWPLLLIVMVKLIFFLFFKQNTLVALMGKGICFAMALFLYLNLFFYPVLLKYQGGMNAAKTMNKNFPSTIAIMYKCSSYSFEWYAAANVLRSSELNTLPQSVKDIKPLIILTTPEQLSNLKNECLSVKELSRFESFPISQLTLPFLNVGSRKKELNYFVLLQCKLKP